MDTLFHRGAGWVRAAVGLALLLLANVCLAQGDQGPTARAVAQKSIVAPGSEAVFAVVLDHPKEFHSWPNAAVKMGPAFDDMVRTELLLGEGSAPGLEIKHVQWPAAKQGQVPDPNGGAAPVTAPLFSGRVTFYVTLGIPADAKPGPVEVPLVLHSQSCNEQFCLPPKNYKVPVTVTVADAAAASAASVNEPDLFKDLAQTKEPAQAAPAASTLKEPAARAVAQKSTVAPGADAVIAVVLSHPEGFHSWPNEEVKLGPAFADMDRTKVSLAEDHAAGLAIKHVQWPAAKPGKVADPEGGALPVTAPLFSGQVTIYVTVAIPADAKPGAFEVPLMLHAQSCNEHSCLPPKDFKLPVAMTIADAAAAAAATVNEPDVFSGLDSKAATATTPQAPPGATGSTPSSPAPAGAPVVVQPPPSIFGISVGGGLILLALAAMLGGAVLNLTPCVLPIIPIKIMTLVEHAGNPRQRIMLGLWMAVGVVAFWLAVGLPVAFFKTLNPNQLIFGHWWVTLGLGLLIALMGLGIMGLFQINLPQAVYMINPKADTARGSFFFGVMAGVLGLPCFGFVAGGLLVSSATLPALTIMVIFASLGIGMAAPYFILTANPKLVEKIPRTGPASELVKQVLGLLILAAAAFFVAVAIRTVLIEKPYLAESIVYWAVAFFVIVAGLWLTIRIFAVSKKAWPRVVMPLLSLAFVGLAIGYAAISTNDDRKEWTRSQSSKTSWEPYTQAALDQGIGDGKVVVVDFTATWCLNCKALKRGVLDRDPLYSTLHSNDILLLEADLTSDEDPSWILFRKLGQTAPPALAIYGPAAQKQPIVMNAYTQQNVLDAIAKARGTLAQSHP